MSQFQFLAIICGAVVFNSGMIIGVAMFILHRTKAATAKCADENRKERENLAAEYKALAEKATTAMVQVGRALRSITDRLPETTKSIGNKETEFGG